MIVESWKLLTQIMIEENGDRFFIWVKRGRQK